MTWRPLEEDRPAEAGIPRHEQREALAARSEDGALEASSRGATRTADALEAAWRLGARFDGWSECFDFDLWMRAFEQVGIDPNAYLRPRDLDEPLPWDHIRTPVVKKFLLAERGKAYAAALTPDCRDHACYRCGAPCFTPKAREGRRLSLQMAPGQGSDPASLAFAIPADITTDEIVARVTELESAPIAR
jgi:hypothetical protein